MSNLLFGRKLFDQTIGLLHRSLDVRALRHKVISSNITNAETVGYTPKDMPFQKILERSVENVSESHLQKTHPQHFPQPGDRSYSSDFSTEIAQTKSGGEGVNIDQEMAKLAENNIMFQAGVQVLMKKLEALRLTISEGR
ncbi:MAG: flagellar basal body rod protein FlgB [Deltaproteobacteria bacterium]|nr:flagellar basal body rod protein FlgB [Deltaproteobacteria bacterium]